MTKSSHGSCEKGDVPQGGPRKRRSDLVRPQVPGDHAVQMNLRDMLAEVVDTAISITQADFGNIQLLDAMTGDLTIMAQRGFPDWWVDYWQSVSKGHGVCGTALEHRERVIVEDVDLSPIFVGTPSLEIQRQAQVRAVQSPPILSRSGTPLGMFSTHFRKPHRPDDRELRLLDLLARQAADTIERIQIDHALSESEERYRNLFVHSPDAIFISQNDRVMMVNTACVQLFGAKTAEQLIGRSIYDLFYAKFHPVIRKRLMMLKALGGAVPPLEKEIMRLDGELVEVEVATVLVHIDGSEAILRILRDITDRKLLERKIIEVSTVEQERLGREIHDGIGQQLTALSLMAGHLERKLDQADHSPEARAVGELGHHLQEALSEVRVLARGLSPVQIGPLGLPDALANLVREVQEAADIRCDLALTEDNGNLPEPAATHLYRIAQEALTNAMKHAQADAIRIELSSDDHMVVLAIRDDGIGIGGTQVNEPGIGLQTMRARSGVIGALLTISAPESGGTLVECTWPRSSGG